MAVPLDWSNKGDITCPYGGIKDGDAVKSDTVVLAQPNRGFSVAVVGDVKVTTEYGDVIVIPAASLAAKVIYPLRIRLLWSTGTAATGILLWY